MKTRDRLALLTAALIVSSSVASAAERSREKRATLAPSRAAGSSEQKPDAEGARLSQPTGGNVLHLRSKVAVRPGGAVALSELGNGQYRFQNQAIGDGTLRLRRRIAALRPAVAIQGEARNELLPHLRVRRVMVASVGSAYGISLAGTPKLTPSACDGGDTK